MSVTLSEWTHSFISWKLSIQMVSSLFLSCNKKASAFSYKGGERLPEKCLAALTHCAGMSALFRFSLLSLHLFPSLTSFAPCLPPLFFRGARVLLADSASKSPKCLFHWAFGEFRSLQFFLKFYNKVVSSWEHCIPRSPRGNLPCPYNTKTPFQRHW